MASWFGTIAAGGPITALFLQQRHGGSPCQDCEIVGATRYRPTIVILTGGPSVQCPYSYFSHARFTSGHVYRHSVFPVLGRPKQCAVGGRLARPGARQSGALPAKSNLAHCALVCLVSPRASLFAAKLRRKFCAVKRIVPLAKQQVKEHSLLRYASDLHTNSSWIECTLQAVTQRLGWVLLPTDDLLAVKL